MADYPKVIEVGGIKVTATDETHEAWWRQNTADVPAAAPAEPVAESASEPEATPETPATPAKRKPKAKIVPAKTRQPKKK